MSTCFPVPQVPKNAGSWGPPSSTPSGNDENTSLESTAIPSTGIASMIGEENTRFHNLPYSPFGRSDRLGRVADFAYQGGGGGGGGMGGGGRGGGGGRSGGYQSKNNHNDGGGRGGDNFYRRRNTNLADLNGGGGGDDDDFKLVDTSRVGTSAGRRGADPRRRRERQGRMRQLNARNGGRGGDDRFGVGGRSGNQPQRTRRGGGRGFGGRFGGRGRGGRGWRDRVDRQASVSVKPEWTLVSDMDLNKLGKTDAPPSMVGGKKANASSAATSARALPTSVEDLLWCGFLDTYNEAYDKCSVRKPATLKRSENKEFYPVTTTDDPVIEQLAVSNVGNVFATDAILAHLMTCTRSVYPWDVIVQKLPGSGAIFFDKRDSSQFDYLTVNETANVPPAAAGKNDETADPDGINTPERLSLEATMINQNFSQQILRSGVRGGGNSLRKTFDNPNPFYDEDDTDGMEPASVAYRYRRFDLGNDIDLVCRSELHGTVRKKMPVSTSNSSNSNAGNSNDGELQYLTAFALNECPPPPPGPGGGPVPGHINWREKIDSQRGAVLATELKNNAFKLARWTAQSMLAGADQMKVGFVSRANVKNAYEHQVLATQTYRPKDFAGQITLNEGSMWSVVRMLVKLFRDQKEGKYVVMRDPNKPVIRVFAVPPGTFEEEDEDGAGENETKTEVEGDKTAGEAQEAV